jgi:hypothetical protein
MENEMEDISQATDRPESPCNVPPPSWKSHPITAGLAVLIVMGSLWAVKEVLAGEKALRAMAKSEVSAGVHAHQAPAIHKVHDVDTLTTREEHRKDVAKLHAADAEIKGSIELLNQDINAKLDALVEKDRGGKYRRRRR